MDVKSVRQANAKIYAEREAHKKAMDVKRLDEFKEALNFIQKSEARTIRVSQMLFYQLREAREIDENLLRGVTANLVQDTALEGLVVHECNTEDGIHDFTNLGEEDVEVEVSHKKSRRVANYIGEEATEFTDDDLNQINLRISQRNSDG